MIKVTDKRTIKNGKEIGNEIEMNGIGKISCELFVFDAYTILVVHQTYLITHQFVDILNTMDLHNYRFQGINCVKDAIHFVFYDDEKNTDKV
jgi:hypothetical protein